MANNDVIRAWKNPRLRQSLGANMPANPAGIVELTDDELKVAGGLAADASAPITTAIPCTRYTFAGLKQCGCGA